MGRDDSVSTLLLHGGWEDRILKVPLFWDSDGPESWQNVLPHECRERLRAWT